jgi:hypothetical protein
MNSEGAVEEQRHTLLTVAPDKAEWLDLRSGRFT